MEIVSLSSNNYVGLTARYSEDPLLKFNQNIYFTEEGIEVPLINIFSQINDTAVNNYSNLFLTTRQPISGTLYIENLKALTDTGFSSYLATNALNRITQETRFLGVAEPPVDRVTANTTVTGTYEFLGNENMFDIEFINDALCKISHENENVVRYLTFDYSGRLIFAKDGRCDFAGDLSPQIFYYMYDKDHNFIVFLKNINDIVKYVAYMPETQKLGLIDPITAADVPYKNAAILKAIPRVALPNDTRLYDPWVSYTNDLKTNSQNINIDRSILNVGSNLLVNSEFYSITGIDMPVNVLSLKNTNTPENYQARSNPFQAERSPLFAENSVELRDYKKLFTGTNQKYGNDNISLGYEAFVTDIVLKPDAITYFHIPQDIYPYKQLNINDSGLIEAGAIPGDHPLKSDKIFKKLGSFRDSSPFGDTIDETTGNFLCSWLSGNWDVNTRPIWVDRYYNPSTTSFLDALTSSPYDAVKYTSVSECLFSEASKVLKNDKLTVFDKPSDLIFEPGTYYAYHHYGPKDVKKFINSLELYTASKDLAVYHDIYDSIITPNNSIPDEYDFNGNNYGITGSLSAIQETSCLTVSFWAKTTDWMTPFATQVIGNFDNDGFGIFNQNLVTPTLYVNSASGAFILNSDINKVKELNFGKEVSAVIKYPEVADYYIIFADGTLNRYNASDVVIETTFNPDLTGVINYDYVANNIYVLCKRTPTTNVIVESRVPILSTGSYTPTTFDDYFPTRRLVFAFDEDEDWVPGNISETVLLNESKSIDYYNDYLYFTPGSITRRVDDRIYYLKNGNTIVRWDDITATTTLPVVTAFKCSTGIIDFNIDYDNNFWLIDNNRSFFKYNSKREFILSGTTSNINFNNFKIGYTANFFGGVYSEQALLMQQGKILLTPDPNDTYTYDLVDDTTGLIIEGLVANTYAPVSADGILFSTIDLKTGQVTMSNSFLAVTGAHFDPTISPYLRKFVKPYYPDSNLNVKTTLVNRFDPIENHTVDIRFNLSALDPGYHHFAARVDSYNGYVDFFVDGQKVGNDTFPPRKFQFDNFSRKPFVVGSSNFINSIPLFKYLKKADSLANDLQVKNLKVFNQPLYDTDIAMLAREGMAIRDIHFNVPCGQRSYIEEIERYFKARVPGTKSSLFNIIIKNSGITDSVAKANLEQTLLKKLSELAPAYTKLNTIKWIN